MATCSNCKASVGCGCNLLDFNGKKLCATCYSVAKNNVNTNTNNELSTSKPTQGQEKYNSISPYTGS